MPPSFVCKMWLNSKLLFFAFGLFVQLVNSNKQVVSMDPLFFPTATERTRGLAVKPSEFWGEQARQDGDVRILALGGSNTWRGVYTDKFNEFVINSVKNTSYLMNYGVAGAGPSHFLGKSYDFERWEKGRWPNLILFEFTVNLANHVGFEPAEQYDKLMRSIKYKYKGVGLRSPDFLLLELFSSHSLYEDISKKRYNLTTSDQRKAHIDRLSSLPIPDSSSGAGNGFNRGNAIVASIREFANFYGLPVLSWRDVAYPAFLRYFTQPKIGRPLSWQLFTEDGLHLSPEAGQMMTFYTFGPFISDLMSHPISKNVTLSHRESLLFDYDVHMFAPQVSHIDILSYSSWGQPKEVQASGLMTFHNTLPLIIKPRDDWAFTHTLFHDDGGHMCYGAYRNQSIAVFELSLPLLCHIETALCHIAMTFIHSWNTSYIGNAECAVYNNNNRGVSVGEGGGGGDRKRQQVGKNMVILGNHAPDLDGNLEHIEETIPRITTIASNLTHGKYTVECRKLDDKHVCIAGVKVYSNVIL